MHTSFSCSRVSLDPLSRCCFNLLFPLNIFVTPAKAGVQAFNESLREALNDLFMRYQVRMKAMGQGSMLTIHPLSGGITSPEDTKNADKRLRQLLFLDLLDQGIYIAERGFMALTLMVVDEDCDRVIGAVERFITERRELLV